MDSGFHSLWGACVARWMKKSFVVIMEMLGVAEEERAAAWAQPQAGSRCARYNGYRDQQPRETEVSQVEGG